jgi:hypothetical protein
MYCYRLHLEDGSDAGEATYAVMVKVHFGGRRDPLRRLDL